MRSGNAHTGGGMGDWDWRARGSTYIHRARADLAAAHRAASRSHAICGKSRYIESQESDTQGLWLSSVRACVASVLTARPQCGNGAAVR